jgi:hypothetical protein
MSILQTVTKKILQPVVLAIAMLFLTPVAGLLQAALMTPVPAGDGELHEHSFFEGQYFRSP